MGATTRERDKRTRVHTTIRLASAVLVLLATPTATAGTPDVSGAAVPAVAAPAELVSGAGGHRSNDDTTSSAPDALARGAATIGELDGRRPASALSTRSDAPVGSAAPSAIAVSFRVSGNSAPSTVPATLGAGSRLFGSRVPNPPADTSSLSGSSGPAGMLTLHPAGTSAVAAADRPSLPPYGRRTTWTFRTPLTRPG